MTSLEKILSKILLELGYRYYEQYELHPYIVDFFIPEFNIALEADGDVWHACRRDRERDIELMKKYSIRVLHFGENSLIKYPNLVKQCIQDEINKTKYLFQGGKNGD